MKSSSLLLLLVGIAGCAVTQPHASAPDALHVQQIGSAGNDDWFAVVNASDEAVDLDDFVFVDHKDDLDRAAGFPAISLAPGERYVQRVSRATQGFQLHRGEHVWIYIAE